MAWSLDPPARFTMRHSHLPFAIFRVTARVALLAAATLAHAASAVEVEVDDTQGQPLPGASVSLVGAGRETITDGQGRARFDSVPAGTYDVAVRLGGFLSRRVEVVVTAGEGASASIVLSDALHFSESVTVSPGGRDTFESYQPTTVLGGEDLQQSLGATSGRPWPASPE